MTQFRLATPVACADCLTGDLGLEWESCHPGHRTQRLMYLSHKTAGPDRAGRVPAWLGRMKGWLKIGEWWPGRKTHSIHRGGQRRSSRACGSQVTYSVIGLIQDLLNPSHLRNTKVFVGAEKVEDGEEASWMWIRGKEWIQKNWVILKKYTCSFYWAFQEMSLLWDALIWRGRWWEES